MTLPSRAEEEAGEFIVNTVEQLKRERDEARSALLAAQQSLQAIEGYLSAEMGDGQLPPRIKDRIDKAYAAARVALGKNPSP